MLKIGRSDLAAELLHHMQSVDEEDVSCLLGKTYVSIAQEDYKAALATLEEIKERHYDSFKLANLKALCLANLGQADPAMSLLGRISSSL